MGGRLRLKVYRKVESVYILILAEIQRIMQFLIHNQLRAVAGCLYDLLGEAPAVLGDVGALALLDERRLYCVVTFLCHGCGCCIGGKYHIGSQWPGSCMVAQWREPCWRISVRQSTVMMSCSGKAIRSIWAAMSSFLGCP